ncbi:hypothetical protein QT381_09175 [Galbitalea sp. SE-J8]|uniref:hypothetical protein n=1 Tax=Galbitalea sp. SE-J8 TaxID=3054952 RepID=UPI00259CBDDF|nr:hypothetical protein [Galbitalea sp. SE-J8]MDM4763179.1 hypothetical protein [Galbitalea sp. SE-J8]
MTVKLNKDGVAHAEKLIRAGRVVRDERDDWSEDSLAAKDETAWLEKHGWEEFAAWHLGIDTDANEETKARYEFPVGDYHRVHRCAIISMESRAAQYDHDDIAKAAKHLLELIDA